MDGIKSFIFISLLFLGCILNQAYFQGAFEVSEAREGVVVNEIKEYNSWLLPLRHGEVVPSKPPLFHWLTALSTPANKSLSNLGLRMVSLLASLICLISVYIFTNRHLLETPPNSTQISPGLIAAISLASTYGFIQMSIDGRVDMLFLSLTLIPILMTNSSFLLGNLFESKVRMYGIGLILGLAILSRGPLALVTFYLCLAVCIALFYRGFEELRRDLKRFVIPFFIIPCLISAPWYLASRFLGKPELISRQLVFENVSRYFGGSNIISKPFWFYLQHIWLQAFPWSIVCMLAGFVYFYSGIHKLENKNKKILSLIGFQILIILLFLSSSSGKRKAYLLPILPLISIIIAYFICKIKNVTLTSPLAFLDKMNRSKVAFYLSCSLLLVCGGSVLLKTLLLMGLINFLSSSFFLGLYELSYSALVLPLIFNIACAYVFFKDRSSNTIYWIFVLFILTVQAYITLPSLFFLTKGESHSFHAFANQINSSLPGEALHVVKTKDDESLDSLLFYLGRRVKLQQPDNPFSQGIYIVREQWFNAQDQNFKDSSEVLMTGKRLADKEQRKVLVFRFSDKSEETLQ